MFPLGPRHPELKESLVKHVSGISRRSWVYWYRGPPKKRLKYQISFNYTILETFRHRGLLYRLQFFIKWYSTNLSYTGVLFILEILEWRSSRRRGSSCSEQVAKGVDHFIRDNFIPRLYVPNINALPTTSMCSAVPFDYHKKNIGKKSVWDKIINSGMDGLVSLMIQVDKEGSIGKVGPTRALFWRCSIYRSLLNVLRFPRCFDNR